MFDFQNDFMTTLAGGSSRRRKSAPGGALRVLACSLICLLAGTRAMGATQWVLTNAQFRSAQVPVDSMDAAGVHLAVAGQPSDDHPNLIKWDDVLELSHAASVSASVPGRFDLYLNNGDHLSGEPSGVQQEKLRWNAGGLGAIDIPLGSIRAICKAGSPPADLRDARTEDTVRLANGDSAKGIIAQVSATGVELQSGTNTAVLDWNNIAAVLFAAPPGGGAAAGGHRVFRVTFFGGAAISVKDVTLTDNNFKLTFDDDSLHAVAASAVVGIEQMNGPVNWLSARAPAENIYRPFFSESFPTRFDQTVDGSQSIHDKFPSFHHGIGCHSYSKLVYDLDGSYAAFRTQFAIDSDSPLADVTVRVLLDDKVVFEKKNVKAGQIYPVISLPLASAKQLSLEVDYGENYAMEDRFAWLDPALTKSAPATVPAAP